MVSDEKNTMTGRTYPVEGMEWPSVGVEIDDAVVAAAWIRPRDTVRD